MLIKRLTLGGDADVLRVLLAAAVVVVTDTGDGRRVQRLGGDGVRLRRRKALPERNEFPPSNLEIGSGDLEEEFASHSPNPLLLAIVLLVRPGPGAHLAVVTRLVQLYRL